ncbi:MAG: NAD(P)H-hydrate dehydratase [Kofleriaceae bacterium]
MQPVVTEAEMRALDRATIEEIGLPALTLMETAGRGVAEAALRMLGAARGHVAVICGPGNNGGDGFVIARVLHARGIDAVAYLAVPREQIRGDARLHLEICERAGAVVDSIATPAELAGHREAIAGATLAIDALFGIGLTRPIEGHLADVVGAINAAARRLAVDIPSGLATDTGVTLGVAVDAQRTVTMAALKIALVSAPGFASCGELEVVDIGIPPALLAASSPRAALIEAEDVARVLPRARALDHKGTRGHVLVVGGGPGMRGAGRLAATGALRAGAGLVTLAGAGDSIAAPDSVMTRALGDRLLGSALEVTAAVVIGPGLGQDAHALGLVREVLAAGLPAVLDADALNVMVATPGELAAATGALVLTPHPGEAARLLGTTTAAIEADRLVAARALARLTRAVVVLKGARTIVCDGATADDHCAIIGGGSPALATAGSGDVLAGVIGAFLAQGLDAGDAARAGVFVHGRAGSGSPRCTARVAWCRLTWHPRSPTSFAGCSLDLNSRGGIARVRLTTHVVSTQPREQSFQANMTS